MVNLTDWSREKKGWWMGTGRGVGIGMNGREMVGEGGKIWWKWE